VYNAGWNQVNGVARCVAGRGGECAVSEDSTRKYSVQSSDKGEKMDVAVDVDDDEKKRQDGRSGGQRRTGDLLSYLG